MPSASSNRWRDDRSDQPRGPTRRTSATQATDPSAMSGEILTAAVTPARSNVPGHVAAAPRAVDQPDEDECPDHRRRDRGDRRADADRQPGARRRRSRSERGRRQPGPEQRESRQAEQRDDRARPARPVCGRVDVNGGATTAAIATRLPKMTADARAPRRAARMPARRRPVGSGRQFGSHGPTTGSLPA